MQFNYYGYRIPQYGNASTVNFEVGAIMHFSEKFNGGIHAYNPVGGTPVSYTHLDVYKRQDKPIPYWWCRLSVKVSNHGTLIYLCTWRLMRHLGFAFT